MPPFGGCGRGSQADAASEPELFWGLRGAGANVGIATSFELRLHPVGPEMLPISPPSRSREPPIDTFAPRSYLELQSESDDHYRRNQNIPPEQD